MALESEKTMFEIYREAESGGRYRVVYFTELTEHNKEREIDRAMRGEHLFDGYLRNASKVEAKRIIDALLERLNRGERIEPEEIRRLLAARLAE